MRHSRVRVGGIIALIKDTITSIYCIYNYQFNIIYIKMYSTIIVLVLVIACVNAFNVMKSSSLVSRRSMTMSMANVPVDVLSGMYKY